jgi:hypothetical protein
MYFEDYVPGARTEHPATLTLDQTLPVLRRLLRPVLRRLLRFVRRLARWPPCSLLTAAIQ